MFIRGSVIMNCGIIYFSATGNTEFIANIFKFELEKNNISCTLIDCTKNKPINDLYDIFVLGCPIYCEAFPDYFGEKILKNLKTGKGRRIIVFGTQVGSNSCGPHLLAQKLKTRGFKIFVETTISLPNNYFVVGFGKTSEENRIHMIEAAPIKVKKIVNLFINNHRFCEKAKRSSAAIEKSCYKLFKNYSYTWAKKRLSIDTQLCIKCGICARDCPTKNINLEDSVTFKANCISCQRCMHNCPVNAFTYKGKHFEQYKKISFISSQ